jgi:hypothetical protein
MLDLLSLREVQATGMEGAAIEPRPRIGPEYDLLHVRDPGVQRLDPHGVIGFRFV